MLYQWLILRIPVILILPVFFLDLEILFFLISFIFVHITLGLKTIFNDYLHNRLSKILLFTITRVCGLEFLRYTLEFLI